LYARWGTSVLSAPPNPADFPRQANAEDAYNLGWSCEQKADYAAAEGWYQQAAGLGHTLAAIALGKMVVQRDADEGMKWLLWADSKGDLRAATWIANWYMFGPNRDIDEALRWYQRAATSENAEVRAFGEQGMQAVQAQLHPPHEASQEEESGPHVAAGRTQVPVHEEQDHPLSIPLDLARVKWTSAPVKKEKSSKGRKGGKGKSDLTSLRDVRAQAESSPKKKKKKKKKNRPTVSNGQGDQLIQLQELGALQQETNAALLSLLALVSGGSRPPDEAYERYLGLARRLAAGAAAFERASPGGFDVSSFAQPLVQWLSMYADHRQAAGDAKAAEQLRQEADELTIAYLKPGATALVRRDRAMQAAMEGRFHDALIGLADARTTFAKAGMVLDKVQTDVQLANIYEWLGDYARALATLEDAHDAVAPQLVAGPPSTAQVDSAVERQLAGMRRGENTKEGEDAQALQRLAFELIQGEARNNRYLGRYDDAERLFLEVRPLAAELGVAAGIDFHLAVIAVARGDVATAHRLLADIAPAVDSGLFRPRRGALRQVQADLHLLRGKPHEALAAADDGLRDQATYPDLELAWKLQWRRARALTALGRRAGAIRAFRAGMSDADRLRMAPLGYRLDTTFVRDKLPMAHDAVDTAIAAADAPAAAWFVEIVKSRALSATISLHRDPAASRTPLEAQFDVLSQRIDALAFDQYSGTGDKAGLEERRHLIAQRDTLLEQIRIHDPRWRTMTEPPPIDLDEIRARLGPTRAALVLQHRTDGEAGRIVAALINAAGVVAAEHDLEPETMAAITKFAENLRRARPNDDLFDLSAEEGIGVEHLLPTEVVDGLAGAETLVVVPHGVLHLLPWACLTVGSHRLFERCAVGILPNLASLPLLDDEPATGSSVALIGAADYSELTKYGVLTESPLEIADVAALYAGHVVGEPATGRRATEAAFWALAEAAGPETVLHYSGHGSLEASEPLASGLVLTESTVDAAELLQHRLPYVEVVLSACSTAWRPQSTRDLYLSGDDALGLPASFLEAGARFLLASIPPVRAKAAHAFTVAWHRHRRAGQSPLQAYRTVQLDSLAAQPDMVYAWAGMTAYGCR
jgi:CHAT domain-containing protein/tetratricopeptide (TPR) repeat protein